MYICTHMCTTCTHACMLRVLHLVPQERRPLDVELPQLSIPPPAPIDPINAEVQDVAAEV
jgi:hypothetical protein